MTDPGFSRSWWGGGGGGEGGGGTIEWSLKFKLYKTCTLILKFLSRAGAFDNPQEHTPVGNTRQDISEHIKGLCITSLANESTWM